MGVEEDVRKGEGQVSGHGETGDGDGGQDPSTGKGPVTHPSAHLPKHIIQVSLDGELEKND